MSLKQLSGYSDGDVRIELGGNTASLHFSPLVCGPQIVPGPLSLDARGRVSCAKSRKEHVNLGNQKGGSICGKNSQAPGTHCTRKSPLPLLPSGPGGVGGSTSRKTDA